MTRKEKHLTQKELATRLAFPRLQSKKVEPVQRKAEEPAKQICLYAMMKQYRLVWDFMIMVIGENYRIRDDTFTQKDINVFFMQLQEQ